MHRLEYYFRRKGELLKKAVFAVTRTESTAKELFVEEAIESLTVQVAKILELADGEVQNLAYPLGRGLYLVVHNIIDGTNQLRFYVSIRRDNDSVAWSEYAVTGESTISYTLTDGFPRLKTWIINPGGGPQRVVDENQVPVIYDMESITLDDCNVLARQMSHMMPLLRNFPNK